jgi:hypothetical protein
MNEDGQNVAGDQDVNHQRVRAHPLHCHGRPPVAVEVDQRVYSGEQEPRCSGSGQGVTYRVQWLIHMHSWKDKEQLLRHSLVLTLDDLKRASIYICFMECLPKTSIANARTSILKEGINQFIILSLCVCKEIQGTEQSSETVGLAKWVI